MKKKRAKLLSRVAAKLKGRELFPEQNKRAKEILESIVVWPDFLKAENRKSS